ncbi:MAG: response regulator [Bacteroidota bacterium]
MPAFQSLINLFSNHQVNNEEETVLNKMYLSSRLLLAISSVLLFSLAISMVVMTQYILAGIMLVLLASSIVFYYLLGSKKSSRSSSVFYMVFSAVVILFGVFSIENSAGILLILIFPAISLLTLGRKKGGLVSVLFFFLSFALIFFLQDIHFFNASFNVNVIIIALAGYMIIHFLVYLMKEIYSENMDRQEKKIEKAVAEVYSRDEFISKLSHQIRTPLNNIMVMSNLLNESQLDDKTKDYFDTILASTNNLVNVVNDIVRVSNIEIKDIKQNKINFNLYTTIDNTVNLYSNQNDESIEINLQCPLEIKKNNILGDPIKVKQVFLNIIENIIKTNSRTKTKIDINLGVINEDETTLQLRFDISCNKSIHIEKNTDTELSTDNLGKVGKRIFQNDLIISKRIIEANKGRLKIDVKDMSTIFTFILPFKKTSKDKKSEVSNEASSSAQKGRKSVHIEDSSVLLVEDNLINQKIVILSLNKLVKNIDIANNGKEALDKFGSSRYDIILMDIQMPVMDGIVATKKIREIEASTNTHTPIIAITANALSGDRENCIAAGMNDYISKPFQVEELIGKMKNLLTQD